MHNKKHMLEGSKGSKPKSDQLFRIAIFTFYELKLKKVKICEFL